MKQIINIYTTDNNNNNVLPRRKYNNIKYT